MMKSETVVPRPAISQALAKASCPICSVLKQFMEDLVENMGPDQATSACKAHTWALAKAAPAEAVVASYLTRQSKCVYRMAWLLATYVCRRTARKANGWANLHGKCSTDGCSTGSSATGAYVWSMRRSSAKECPNNFVRLSTRLLPETLLRSKSSSILIGSR